MPLPSSSGTPFELWRRLLPLILAALTMCFSFYTDLSPLYSLRDPDFARQQKSLHQWTEEQQALARLPLDQYIATVTRDKTIKVQGREWSSFFDQAFGAFQSGRPSPEWEQRLNSMDKEYGSHIHLFFQPGETPLNTLPSSLQPGNTYYLQLTEKPERIMELYYKKPELGPLGASDPGIPSAFAYPLRRFGWLMLAAALLIYLLLPWPRHREGLVEYQRPRIIIADIVGFLLFSMFFVIPLAVVGSFQAAITEYLPFTLICWAMAALGLLLVYLGIRFAKYRIFMGDDRIRIFNLNGWQDFVFSQVDYIQPAYLRPPSWLIVLSFLGGASGSLASAGQGLLLSVSDSPGFFIHSTDGASAYIWFSDQMGNVAMRNVEALRSLFLKAGLPVRQEALDIRAVFPPEK